MSSRYGDETRAWAEKTFAETRHQYNSRLECCQAIAKVLGAHVNTVSRWIGESYGPARQAPPEEVTAKMRALEEEVQRLRRQNHDLASSRGIAGRTLGLA
ncbi:transposase [Rhodococcus sp. NPDC019627]|uniref:Transposase n=1 Tax=Rhodococcus oxybenzonivorans TaxID=1990687 RepID=A0A2S2C854_9NOCA|nr:MULTISPECIES: transposase [Rhodococcus]AWK77056.1 transposase [Rhodococcus oxybenzonivorans]QHE73034.1 hypothetical protein GFS60_06685 [Rhodococcus sp. WAY2]QTJ71257.1 transposase [Rhodococcus sp. ZPP]